MQNKIKLFVMDVDGTLTDGNIYLSYKKEFFKAFNVKDGYGIREILFSKNIKPIIISGRKSKIVNRRCKELNIDMLYQGARDKLKVLEEILNKYNILFSNVAYIGDDINDLPCINAIVMHGGVVGCPADAVEEVKNHANFISNKNGGHGAVRDFIDWLNEKNLNENREA